MGSDSARELARSRAIVERGTSRAALPRSPSAGGPVLSTIRRGRPKASRATSPRSFLAAVSSSASFAAARSMPKRSTRSSLSRKIDSARLACAAVTRRRESRISWNRSIGLPPGAGPAVRARCRGSRQKAPKARCKARVRARRDAGERPGLPLRWQRRRAR